MSLYYVMLRYEKMTANPKKYNGVTWARFGHLTKGLDNAKRKLDKRPEQGIVMEYNTNSVVYTKSLCGKLA